MAGGRLLITVIRVGTICGINGPVVFMVISKSMHKRFIGDSLTDNYILHEGYCMIINANYYMDDATCSKSVEVLAPHIFKMSVRVVGYF